ncbi:unnamed protein product [Gadus morhua 'NCC']
MGECVPRVGAIWDRPDRLIRTGPMSKADQGVGEQLSGERGGERGQNVVRSEENVEQNVVRSEENVEQNVVWTSAAPVVQVPLQASALIGQRPSHLDSQWPPVGQRSLARYRPVHWDC